MKRIQFWTANHYKEWWINIDLNDDFWKIDLALDMNKFSYPWEDNSIDYIYISHTLEHLEYPEKTIEEFNRILKKWGILEIVSPYKELYWTIQKTIYE